MRMQLQWDGVRPYIVIWYNKGRTEIRGEPGLATDRELLNCDVALFINALHRRDINLSALHAGDVVHVRYESRQAIVQWLAWHEKVACRFDGKWIDRDMKGNWK